MLDETSQDGRSTVCLSDQDETMTVIYRRLRRRRRAMTDELRYTWHEHALPCPALPCPRLAWPGPLAYNGRGVTHTRIINVS